VKNVSALHALAGFALALCCIDTAEPRSKLVYVFPGNWCGVPTVIGHYLVQSVPAEHGFIVLDVADAAKPVEVSRLVIGDRCALTIDEAFRDIDGRPGFSFSERDWPHGWHAVGTPHGAVFTR
jgi:hypothetical protein